MVSVNGKVAFVFGVNARWAVLSWRRIKKDLYLYIPVAVKRASGFCCFPE
jgi:hypothetical protein